MSEALMLPSPETITLTQVRNRLLPASVHLRQQIEQRRDVPAAQEMRRQLEAFRKYLQDKEGRDLIAAECRRTELLIGKLLGTAEQTYPGKNGSPTGKPVEAVSREDRHTFVMLAESEQ